MPDTLTDRGATIIFAALIAVIIAVSWIAGPEPTLDPIGGPCPGDDSAGYVLTDVYDDGSFRCEFVAPSGATAGI